MRDDAMPMRGAYDAPRASMSPMETGKGIMGGGIMGGGRRRYNIRNSSFIDLAIPSYTSGYFYTAVHVFVLGFYWRVTYCDKRNYGICFNFSLRERFDFETF